MSGFSTNAEKRPGCEAVPYLTSKLLTTCDCAQFTMVLYFRVLQPIQLARLSVHTLTSNKFDALAFAKCAARRCPTQLSSDHSKRRAMLTLLFSREHAYGR